MYYPTSQLQSNAEARAQDSLLLKQAQGNSHSSDKAKIEKAGHDFESILLGSWLQGAEESFAAAPGGKDDDDDGTSSQYMGMAMQQLAGTLSAGGGIGIAKMITAHLESIDAADERAKVPALVRNVAGLP